jgi:hypothetical protein
MLRRALAEALGKLALTQSVQEGGSRLDIIEEHHVMVILECVWSVGLRVGYISGDAGDTETDPSHQDDGDVTMMDRDREDQGGQ